MARIRRDEKSTDQEHGKENETEDENQDSLPPPYQSSLIPPLDNTVGDKVTVTAVGVVLGGFVAESVWTNPVVQNAVQVLESLSDIGRTLPFVAPAFIVLKLIIDVERKARDADLKCNDLIERITFMLSHLPALKDIRIMDATKRVIDRMNDALQSAAALIQAYRQQNRIVRRLNVNNKDKFDMCATSIDACCVDLMTSLQIQQVGQLDILTRAVPVDPEDVVARTFLSSHGGVDAVKGNQSLVTEFAQELHLKMDDDVMDQLNANFTQLLEVHRAQIEQSLNENVSTAIIDGIKALAAQMNEAEKEQVLKCVQCDHEYRNSTNGPTSCSFHSAEYSSWNSTYACCSTQNPCQFQYHRSVHHCEYPYGAFFPRARNVLNYVDTLEEWVSLEDTNLKNDKVSKASIGRLRRWVSGGQLLEPTILITVGAVYFSESYFFESFIPTELSRISKAVSESGQTIIFRTTPNEDEFAMVEWVLSSDKVINGVRLVVKATTSEMPYIRVCPIDIASCTKSGEIVVLSDGGLRSFTPASPYKLPKDIRITSELSDKPLRPVRTDFKTRTSPNLPVILKVVSEPPLKANPQFANTKLDNFEGTISVFNKHPAGSLNPITFGSVSAYFRLVGDKTYTPVESFKLVDSQLPVTIEPRQSWFCKFQVAVPRPDEDAKLEIRWWNRAFICRHRPLRLKIVMQDVEEEEASLVLEHVFNPYPLEKPKESDLGFFWFDNFKTWDRHYIRVAKADSGIINVGGHDFDTRRLEKIVYNAVETGETEIELKIGQEKDGGAWEWNAWALIDLSCRSVYAFKVIVTEGRLVTKKTAGCLGYVLCPKYGNPLSETRPVRYASEIAKLPHLEPLPVRNDVADDTVDDSIAAPPSMSMNGSASFTALGSAAPQMPADLTRHLASIDSNLSRIAVALEQLVGVLTTSSGR